MSRNGESMSAQNDQSEVIKYSTQIMSFLEELVGGASHEINNLLFIINMSSELIEIENDPAKRLETLKVIDDQSKKIVSIISELRNVIKDCAKEEVKETRLTDVSAHVIQLSKTRFNNHKVILKNNVPENVVIKCRENQLAQAFLAILNSAHDSVVNNKGFNRWISFDTQESSGKLQILIKDSGAKIPVTETAKIFSPSFDYKSRKGLPLLIAKNIIESHGGIIEYVKEDKDNTFMITLPSYKIALSQEAEIQEDKAG